ncbi:MAG: glucosaminidase domain-containing protein, partial [Bacteroidota bacterium]
MTSPVSPQSTALGRLVAKALDYAVHYAVEILLILLILYLCIARGLSFSVDIYDPLEEGATKMISEASVGEVFSGLGTAVTTLFSGEKTVAIASPVTSATDDTFNSVARTDDPAPHISNLTLVLSPDYGERKGLPEAIITAKKERVQNYLDRYATIAQREMRDFGIPASITLAQGLLESNAGD